MAERRVNDLQNRLTRMGVTDSGRAWLTKALHPPSDDRSPGLPDESATAVLRPEYRVQKSITGPAAGSWDCLIWAVPGDCAAVYYAAAPSDSGPADFTASTPPMGAIKGTINIQEPVCLATAGSSWYPIGVGASPGAFSTTSSTVASYAFRHQYKSVTVQLVAPAVADQGEVYAAQFAPTNSNSYGVVTGRYLFPPGLVSTMSNYAQFNIPLDESQLALMSPEYYTGSARDGVFMPLRLTGPTQPYVTRKVPSCVSVVGNPYAWLPYLGVAPGPVTSVPAAIPDSASGVALSSWIATYNPTDDMLATPVPASTGFDNINQGVIIFRGLSGSGGGGGGFAASLMIKVVAGLEIIPSSLSADRVYASPPTHYDERALAAYYAIALELDDAYPASFNSLATILGIAGTVASTLWPYVKAAAPVAYKYIESKIDSFMGRDDVAEKIRSKVDAAVSKAAKTSVASAGGRKLLQYNPPRGQASAGGSVGTPARRR